MTFTRGSSVPSARQGDAAALEWSRRRRDRPSTPERFRGVLAVAIGVMQMENVLACAKFTV